MPPSPSERLASSLQAIMQHAAATNAFIRVDGAAALASLETLPRGPLHGMPISIKDLIDIAGQPTTAASNVRRRHVAERDAPVISRLREAGAVLIGKTNLHEFALGTTSEDSAFGAVRNPRDLARSPGGSSGGSAAAVAAGMGEASIGSDTGGSIRIPAAACGVVGLKGSYGEIPTDGVIPLSVSFDHVGPIARSVRDASAIWSVLAGRPIHDVSPPRSSDITLGELGGYFTALLDSDVRAAFVAALETLRGAGVRVAPRTIERADTIMDVYVDISLYEAGQWHAPTLDAQPNDYQPSVRDRLERGRAIPSERYERAKQMRGPLRAAVNAALDACDALVLPTLPIVAPRIGATDVTMDNGQSLPVRAAMLRLTQLFNVTGHPAVSLPIRTTGLPVGLQLVGRLNDTPRLIDVAAAVETALA